jgi:hypothetical protein
MVKRKKAEISSESTATVNETVRIVEPVAAVFPVAVPPALPIEIPASAVYQHRR